MTTIHSTKNFFGREQITRFFQRIFLIILLLTGISSGTFAQQNVHYRFRLQGVTDPAGAKMVTDILRPVFNTTEDPFAIFPTFNDELDLFDFFSPIVVSEGQLEAALAPHGILLIAFSNENEARPQFEKQ